MEGPRRSKRVKLTPLGQGTFNTVYAMEDETKARRISNNPVVDKTRFEKAKTLVHLIREKPEITNLCITHHTELQMDGKNHAFVDVERGEELPKKVDAPQVVDFIFRYIVARPEVAFTDIKRGNLMLDRKKRIVIVDCDDMVVKSPSDVSEGWVTSTVSTIAMKDMPEGIEQGIFRPNFDAATRLQSDLCMIATCIELLQPGFWQKTKRLFYWETDKGKRVPKKKDTERFIVFLETALKDHKLKSIEPILRLILCEDRHVLLEELEKMDTVKTFSSFADLATCL